MIRNSKFEFIVFRSPQLRCDLSGLSVNVGESQITQSLKVRDLGVTFDQFHNFDDHITAICRSTYFHIRNIGKIRNLLSYNACSAIIHALISCRLDYCNSLLYNVPTHKTDRLQRLQNQCARLLLLCSSHSVVGKRARLGNVERAGGGFNPHCGQKVKSEKSECNNSGYELTGLIWWP